MSRFLKYLDEVIKLVLAFIGVSAFGIAILKVYTGDIAQAGTAFGGGALIMVFVFLAQFKRFKGFGLEAETWEKTIEEARDTVDQLRQLAVVTSKPILSIAGRIGRWDATLSRKERYELRLEVAKLLAEVEVPHEEIAKLCEPIKIHDLYDMANDIFVSVRAYFNENVEADLSEKNLEIQTLQKSVFEDVKLIPERFEDFLTELSLLNEEQKNELLTQLEKDLVRMKTFRDQGEINDLQEWIEKPTH